MPDERWEELQAAIRERKAVVLVGAGASIQISGNPEIGGHRVAGWTGLLAHGLQRCEQVTADATVVSLFRELLEKGRLLEVAQFVSDSLHAPDGGEFARWLEDTVGKLEPRDKTLARALGALDVPLWTTNYDTLLEQVTRRRTYTWKDGNRWQRVQDNPRAGVVHLHGVFDLPETVVLGSGSYDSVMRDAATQSALRSLASMTSLVFVGFGAGIADPNFIGLRRFLSTVLRDATRRHYRLVVDDDVEAARAEHEQDEHIHVLGHGSSHDTLQTALLALAPESPDSPRVPRPTKRPRPVLEIEIGSSEVIAKLGEDGPVESKLELDELRLETVMLLDEWLRFQEDQSDDERSKRSDVARLMGSILFDAVLNGDVRELYRRELKAATPQAPLSIVLSVRPEFLTRFDRITPVGLTQLPWELLCDYQGQGGYLSTSPKLTFSRIYPGERDMMGWEATSEPRVLVILAQPEGLVSALRHEWDQDRRSGADDGRTGYDAVVREIVETVKNVDRRAMADKRVLVVGADDPATADRVQEALQSHAPQIVHYIGHGRARLDRRYIAFADPSSDRPDWRSFTEFARSIDEDHPPMLVFLHLCQGPRSLQANEVGGLARGNFSTLAFELIQHQVGMVVAMQYPASADIGLAFTQRFYAYLSAGRTAAEAVQTARNDVRKAFPVGGPVLYLRGADGAVLRPEGTLEEATEDSHPPSLGGPTITTTTRPPLRHAGDEPSRGARPAAAAAHAGRPGGPPQPPLLPDLARDVAPRQRAGQREEDGTINVDPTKERP